MVAQFVIQVLLLPMALSLGAGDKAKGFEKVMLVFAITGVVCFIITFLTTKERIVPKPEEKSSLKEDLSDLFKNKPWIIMLTTTTLVFITLAMKGGSYVYYFNNYVDRQSLTEFVSPIVHTLSNIGLNFFGEDPVSAGFGETTRSASFRAAASRVEQRDFVPSAAKRRVAAGRS